VSVNGNVWTFVEPNTRAIVTIRDSGRTMDFRWGGGSDWLPLCDRVARRVE
jgi:hypothetical protein